MTKYKVGDVAALFSKPSPTTTGGKKLQSLFEEYYSKKGKSAFQPQEVKLENNANGENMQISDTSAFKKGRKRKFSSNDSELEKSVSSKKFKESFEQEGIKVNKNKKHKFKKQKDFQWKIKQENANSLTFPKFEPESASTNESESPSVSKLKNTPKDNKQNINFIKKSKKQSLEHNRSKLSNDISCRNPDDSDDASLKAEVKEFMQNNSEKKKFKKSNDGIKQESTFNKKGQDNIGKPKKTFLMKENGSFLEKSPEQQNKKSKKKKKMNNNNQQDFSRTKKEFKGNLINFSNSESKVEYYDDDENSPLKKLDVVEQDNVKKSKHGLNDIYANTPKTNTVTDFIRKPKNKKDSTFDKNNVTESNSTPFKKISAGKNVKNGAFYVNEEPEEQVEGFKVDAPDFIKLHSADEGNEHKFAERLSRTLFVGNLPKNISKQELRNLFTAFGTIDGVRLPGIETDKAKIFGKNPPKLLHANYASDTIPGFIVFRDKQSAVEALKLSGSTFKGHHITVDFAMAPGSHKLYDNKRSIFIGNLPFDVKDESIWNAFNHCGRIEGVRVVRDRQTGLGKGFGYVLFSTAGEKENAIALKNVSIEGREIRIKPVDSNKKTQKSDQSPNRRDSFKSRAIWMKKNKKGGANHKSIRKLTNKQKILHKKKKTAAILQKAMK